MAEHTDEQLKESIGLQLSEVEMLQSMFPGPNEFCIDKTSSLQQMQAYVDGEIPQNCLDSRLGFTLNLEVGEPVVKLEVICQLAHEYPSVPPNIFLRAPSLDRSHHSKLTEDLLNNMYSQEPGELYMLNMIPWLQENAENYISVEEETNINERKKSKQESLFSRMWIYSHHLYSKIKRKDILFYTAEYNLTGFSMAGKPGIIVIEGLNSNVEEFWGRVRRWQWKRIVMKEKEDYKIVDNKTEDDLRIFPDFQERVFAPRQAKGRGHHGDRGMLFSFLEERGCAHIFPLFFGVEGRPAEPDSD